MRIVEQFMAEAGTIENGVLRKLPLDVAMAERNRRLSRYERQSATIHQKLMYLKTYAYVPEVAKVGSLKDMEVNFVPKNEEVREAVEFLERRLSDLYQRVVVEGK